MHEIGERGKFKNPSMTYTLDNKCAKNCCIRKIVQLIVEDVVMFFVTGQIRFVGI